MDFALPIAITPVMPEKSQFLLHARMRAKRGFFSSAFNSVVDHFIPHARNNYFPHIFSRRLTGLLSVLLISAKIFTVAALAWGPVAPAFSEAITPTNIISLTNQSRQANGFSALTENSLLDSAAQSKANDMLQKGYFSHNTPSGQTPWDFITSVGYNYITAGENLAVNFTQAENVETAWMNSPGHRANILNKNYQDIGIGISQGSYLGHAAIFVVQMFGTLADQKIALSDVPTKVMAQSAPLPAAQAFAPAVLGITSQQVSVSGNNVNISTQVSGPAVKVLAMYGQQGVMLAPGPNNSWTGSLSLSSVASGNNSLVLKVYDMSGNLQSSQMADFSGSTPVNYNLAAQTQTQTQTPGAGQNFYLIFIAAILTCLILAIAIKHRVQHVSLVANGAFMVILAIMLWVR